MFTNEAPPYLNSWRSTRHILNQDQTRQLDELLRRIGVHSKQRGIDILTAMEQFDKHQMGEITESQFYRSFIGPTLTEAEMTLLRDKYSDPSKPGMINYLNFVHDVNNQSSSKVESTWSTSQMETFVGLEEKVCFGRCSTFIVRGFFLERRTFGARDSRSRSNLDL